MPSIVTQRKWLLVVPMLVLLLGIGVLAGDASAGRVNGSAARGVAGAPSTDAHLGLAPNAPVAASVGHSSSYAPQQTCSPETPTRVPTPAFTPGPGCSDVPPDGDLEAFITDDFNTTQALFTNHSSTCSYRIGLATYRKFDENIDNQELYDYSLAVIPPNSTLVLTVNNPTCAYQGDAFYGDILYSLAGGARYDERRLDDTDGLNEDYCPDTCPSTPTPTPTPTGLGAFLVFVPESGAPGNGGTVNVGDRFVLDLMVDSGSHSDLTAQQSYLTFTYQLIQNARVDQIPTSCVLASTVTPDLNTFDTTLQNEVCNGPNPCVPESPGSMAYASGALNTCLTGCGGFFRVAQVGLCAVAPGQAVLHWQFSPPSPPTRNTEIVAADTSFAHDPALFTDYVINIANQTSPGPLMVGHVTWQGRPPQPDPKQQVPIRLTLSSGSTQVNYVGISTDAYGFFTVTLGSLPNGNYAWRVKGYDPQWGGPAFLANSGTVSLSGATTTQVEMDLMRAGDANNDNVATSIDFSILRNMFGRSCTPCSDPRADFNGDGVINVLDFSLLRSNFGTSGAP